MRVIAKALLAAACLCAAVPAAAQTIRPARVVAFGDSYADNGNVFRISGTPFPSVYPTGRFSGGTNFIDTLQQLFNAQQINFAIGGALAGPGNTGTNNISSPFLPGFQFEVASFLAGGGGPFPTVTPRFAADDLVAVSIGGNDARLYELTPGSTVAGAAPRAAVAVADATRGLDQLFGAGARNILFLAGNVGELPEVRGTPLAAIGSAFSNAFNQGIQAPLSRYAANGALVHYLDLTLVGNRIRENPAAYGLVSADACPIACVSNPALQSQFLFYVDQVHLTSAGFNIVGQYFQRQVQAPGLFEAQTDTGLSSASDFGRVLSGRLDLGGDAGERPLSLFVLGTTSSHDSKASPSSFAYDYDNSGVSAGLEYQRDALLAGIALSYSRPEVRGSAGGGRTEARAYQVGGYLQFDMGGPFVEGYAGYGRVDYELQRDAVIDEIVGEPRGDNLLAGAEAGFLFPFGGLKIGPIVGVDYARARIDGFTERGDAALTQNVSRQKLDSLVGHVGAELGGDIDTGGVTLSPFIKAMVEKEFEDDGTMVRFAGTASPTIVNSWRVGEASNDPYGRIEAGASVDIDERFALQIQGSATIEREDGNEYGGFLGLKVRF